MKVVARLQFFYKGRNIAKGEEINLSQADYEDLKESGLIRKPDDEGKGMTRAVPTGFGFSR